MRQRLWRDTIPGSLERLTAPEKGHDARLLMVAEAVAVP